MDASDKPDDEQSRQADDQPSPLSGELAELLAWVQSDLKGKQRRVMELMIAAQGKWRPLEEIATDSAIRWAHPYDNTFNKLRAEVNKRLENADVGWKLERKKINVRIKPICWP
jgi:hypothetical protein